MARKALIVCPGGVRNRGSIGRGVSYTIAAWQASGEIPAYRLVDPRGTGNVLLSPFYFLATLAILLVEGLGRRLSVVHIHMASKGSTLRKLFILVLSKLLTIPVILHLHGGNFDGFYRSIPGFAQAVVRWMFRTSDLVILLGESWRRFAAEEMGLDPDPILVMNNAVPAGPPPPGERAPGPIRLLFLGLLGPRKGVPELLAALAQLRDLDWQATLAGNGAVDEYRRQAEELGLGDRIAFPGWALPDEAERLLCEADALLLPSHAEGQAMAVLEALAHGLPVITTAVGSMTEAIDDGVSGLMVPPGDADALAAAIKRLIEDPGLRDQLSEGARARFAEKFDMRNYAAQITALYREYGTAMTDVQGRTS